MRDPCVCMVQLEEVYGEVFRVLKPGGMFCSYEWVATKEFDPNDSEHVRIIDEINFGNGLPVRASAKCAAMLRCLAVPEFAQIRTWRHAGQLIAGARSELGHWLGAGDEDIQGGRAGREACGL